MPTLTIVSSGAVCRARCVCDKTRAGILTIQVEPFDPHVRSAGDDGKALPREYVEFDHDRVGSLLGHEEPAAHSGFDDERLAGSDGPAVNEFACHGCPFHEE